MRIARRGPGPRPPDRASGGRAAGVERRQAVSSIEVREIAGGAARRRGRLFGALLAAAALAAPCASASARPAPDSFADLADQVLPAVVNISTTQSLKREESGRPEMPQLPPGSPFEDFFKDFFDRQQRSPSPPPRRTTSLGSGFVIDPSGLIVTNHHVVKDADEIVARFSDDRALPAEVVGRDPKTDLALLRVKTDKPLPALKFGDSSSARVGDWVIAIGNPFGLGGSVTAGIISARQRDINAGPYDDFIQTDASINRGNSGGPLVNLKGEVIGVNTAIFSPSGGSVGIGFAVPASLVEPVIEQLREFGEPRRGWLGVRIQSVNEEIAESLGLGTAHGALVASTTPGGPAEKAGIEPGDVILKFDGKEVEKMRRLPRIVAETRIGAQVPVELWRKGKIVDVTVEVGHLEESEETQVAAVPPADKDLDDTDIKGIGARVSALTPDLRSRFEIGEDAKGVVVTNVDAGGPAGEKGIEPGDVIVEVNQDPVRSPQDVAAKIGSAADQGRRSVLLLVDRKGDLRFVAVSLAKG